MSAPDKSRTANFSKDGSFHEYEISEIMGDQDKKLAKTILEQRPIRERISTLVSPLQVLIRQYDEAVNGIISRHPADFSGFPEAFSRLTTSTESKEDKSLIIWFLLNLSGSVDISEEDRQTIRSSRDQLEGLFDDLKKSDSKSKRV